MRRALAALLVTAVAVVLLARYDTDPPRTLNPNSALPASSADIDVVTGATYTSESWKESLQAEIDRARSAR